MPPWLIQLMKDSQQQNIGPYAQTTAPNSSTNAPRAPNQSRLAPAGPSGGRVSGGDMADIFARSLDQQNQADQARSNFKNNLFFGRHLGLGGGEMSPGNPTGDPRDPWNNPAFFAGNPTNRAAQAIQQQPLWSVGPGGQLTHGTNYPGFPPAGGGGSNGQPGPISETLPAMGAQEQADTLRTYAPPTNAFTDRGLDLTPLGLNPNVLRPKYVPPPPPPPPPPPSES